MKIEVTQKHIDSGEPLFNDICPIALAIKDTKTDTYARVHGLYCVINRKYYQLPFIAIEFISMFDDSKEVKPFTLVLDKGYTRTEYFNTML